MTTGTPFFRPAEIKDARAVAELIAVAGEGIPLHFWSQKTSGTQTPLDIGAERASREDANFSYRNAVLAWLDGKAVAMLLAYRLPPPSPEEVAELKSLPDLIRPFVELEHEAPESFYINALAVHEGYRGSGLGARLLTIAEERARDAGCSELSIGVFEQNLGAVRLYRRHGYAVKARRPIVQHPCYPYDSEALLMTKSTPDP